MLKTITICIFALGISLSLNYSVFAEQVRGVSYSTQAMMADQQKRVQSQTQMIDQKNNNMRDLKYWVTRLMENVRQKMDDLRWRQNDMRANQEDSRKKAQEISQRIKDLSDKQKQQIRDQESRMHDLRDQTESIKQRQKDMSENLKIKK